MNKLIQVLFSLVAVSFIISSSVIAVLNFDLLYKTNVPTIAQETGFSEEIILENYQTLISYNELTSKDPLVFPDFPMSVTGEIHFEEVKVIFNRFEQTMIITGVIFLVGIIWMIQKRLYDWLLYTGVLSIGIPIFLGVFVLLDWNRAFVLFHEIAFNNSYWLFDPKTDPIITILPDTFFLQCALFILIFVLGAGSLCFYLYKRMKQKYARSYYHTNYNG